MVKLSYLELGLVIVGIVILAIAVSNYTKPLNKSMAAGCQILVTNYSCDPTAVFSVVVPDYKIEDGSYAHLVDVCARLGISGQNECARSCGC